MDTAVVNRVLQLIVLGISIELNSYIREATSETLRGWTFLILAAFVTASLTLLTTWLQAKAVTVNAAWRPAWHANAALASGINIASSTLTGGLLVTFVKNRIHDGETVQWELLVYIIGTFVFIFMMFNGYSHSQFYDKNTNL